MRVVKIKLAVNRFVGTSWAERIQALSTRFHIVCRNNQ